MIAKMLGIVFQAMGHKEKRANAYDFPLEAVSRTGEAGDDAGSGPPSAAETNKSTDQQQLDTVAVMDDGDQVADAALSATDGGPPEGTAKHPVMSRRLFRQS